RSRILTTSRRSKSTPLRCSMKVVTKCCRVCSPSLTISSPACCCSNSARRNASCLPSTSSSPWSFHGDQSFSGSASQDGFGKLPAVAVGINFLMSFLLVWWVALQIRATGLLLELVLVRFDEVGLGVLALFARQLAAFFPVVETLGERISLIIQARL